MNLIFIFGPPAVGKMTVGQELALQTGYKLFHNHMTIEALLKIFPFESNEFQELNSKFRRDIFQKVAESNIKGFIITYVWPLDKASDKKEADSYTDIFARAGAKIHYVELEAPQDIRLHRNRMESRLKEKPSKRDFEFSDRNLIDSDQNHRLNSDDEHPFFYLDRYLKIDSSKLEPQMIAHKIIKHFNL